MNNKIILCKHIAQHYLNQVSEFTEKEATQPQLAVILVGDNPASQLYVKNKIKAAEKVGIKSTLIQLSATTTQAQLELEINKLNQDQHTNGILLQLPLPEGLNSLQAINQIDPLKDVDGLTSTNVGKLEDMPDKLLPCTPLGILRILENEQVNLQGKEITVVGRSRLVGRPIANLLAYKDATVTMCHRFTESISQHIKRSDIVIIAAGHPNLVKGEDLKKDAIVIDVGINPITNTDGTQGIVGDAHFESCLEQASRITPVPGGVGPMTVASLMTNTVDAYLLQNNQEPLAWHTQQYSK